MRQATASGCRARKCAALLLLLPGLTTAAPPTLGPEPPTEPLGPTPPDAAAPADNQFMVTATDIHGNDRPGERAILATGNVTAHWRDLMVTTPRLFADLETDLARLDGPIHLARQDGSFLDTEFLTIDLDKYWTFSGPFTGELSPAFIGYGAVEALRIEGSDALTIRDTYFAAHNVLVTSCPPRDLKYHLTARTVAVVPNRKIILRSARAYLFGVPIFAWGKLVIPLRQYRRTEWLPEVGRNDIYGVYARMRYFYDIADSQLGNLSGMVTEKRGTFWGLEHDFGYGRGDWRGVGDFDLEYGSRNAELSVRGALDQGMGPDTSLRLNGAFSQNSGFSTTSRQSNLTGLLTHNWPVGTTSLQLNRTANESGGQRSTFDRLGLNQRLQIGQLFTADLNADYSARGLTGQPTDEELLTRARFGGRLRLFDWELIDERRFDLEGGAFPGDDNRPVTEIVPQVTLRTDSRRIGLGLPDLIDVQLDTSVGQLREFVQNPGDVPDSRSTVLRVNFDLRGRLNRVAFSPSTRFLADVRYSQSFFDHPNPSAKYIIQGQPRFEWKPSRYSRIDLGYRWQEVAGFSPLRRFDFAQTINDFDYGLTLFWPHPARPRNGVASMRFSGGYDFLTGRARDLRINALFQPIHEVLINLNTSYALDGRGIGDAGLRAVRAQLLFETGPRYQHEIGLTYDPRDGTLDNLDSLIYWELIRRFSVQQALTWDGRSERVSFHDLLATLDLGCVQLVGTYRQSVQEYRLDINITAFPGLASLFGTGRQGQQFSTSQGFSF